MNLAKRILNKQFFTVNFRVHCWNYYGKNKEKECPDLEIRYFIDCSTTVKEENHQRKKRSSMCQSDPSAEISQQKEPGPPVESSRARRENYFLFLNRAKSINHS